MIDLVNWNHNQILKLCLFHKTLSHLIKTCFHIFKSLCHLAECSLEKLCILRNMNWHYIIWRWLWHFNWLTLVYSINLSLNIYWHPEFAISSICISLSNCIAINWFLLSNNQSFGCDSWWSSIKWSWIWSWHSWGDHYCFYNASVLILNFRFWCMDWFVSFWWTKYHWVDSTCL